MLLYLPQQFEIIDRHVIKSLFKTELNANIYGYSLMGFAYNDSLLLLNCAVSQLCSMKIQTC